MIKIASLPTIAGAFLAFGLSAAPAAALVNRTWVSGKGTDSGTCALAAPCRTFAFALTQTAERGEIDVLDPADYDSVTITKAISIVNDGIGTAGIHVDVVPAIRIDAGAFIHLRGLTIDGGSEVSGIEFFTGGNLEIENCVIRNFAIGILFSPRTSSSFLVSNTIVSNNHLKSNRGGGILVAPSGAAVVTGVLSKVTARDNTIGISVAGGTTGALNVTIVGSVFSNSFNSGFGDGVGVLATSGRAATAAMLRNVVASNNGTGLEAAGTAILRVAHSVVTGNGTGVSTSGGTIQSYGDNDIDGNTNNNTGALTPLAMY